ncbi:hypothetical protein AKJ16_DCAP15689 [Drosera capensis]
MASHFVAGKKPGHPCSSLMKYLLAPVYQVSPFWINLFYFVLLSTLGFLSLKITKPRDGSLDDLDLFFTSVSASTVSSMSIVEMEAFSNVQLIILTVLMLMGAEVFTSMLEFRFRSTELPKKGSPCTNSSIELVELGKFDLHPSTTYSKHDGIRIRAFDVLAKILSFGCYCSWVDLAAASDVLFNGMEDRRVRGSEPLPEIRGIPFSGYKFKACRRINR